MAGRRRNTSVMKPKTISDSTYIAIMLGTMLILFITSLSMFGVDLGFIELEGKFSLNRTVVLGAVAVCILISYVVDLLYLRSMRGLYKLKTEPLLYIPFFGFLWMYGGWLKWTAIVTSSLIVLIALISFTPLSSFMPSVYLFEYAHNAVPVMIGLMVVMVVIRGMFCSKAKNKSMAVYKKQINNSYGFGGATSYVAYFIYFLPIIRCLSLYTDANFNNSLRVSLDDKSRREE